MGLNRLQYQHFDCDAIYPCARFMCTFFQKERAQLNAINLDLLTAKRKQTESDKNAKELTRHGNGAPGEQTPGGRATAP